MRDFATDLPVYKSSTDFQNELSVVEAGAVCFAGKFLCFKNNNHYIISFSYHFWTIWPNDKSLTANEPGFIFLKYIDHNFDFA